MSEKLKKLTEGLIIFSVLASDYERLDFKSDALAGVRANYFNSNNSAQSDKTEVILDAKTYNLSYFMCKNEPLSWKITRNNRPYQSVKRATGSVYCVIVYGENGIINKRIYFDDKHSWLRTEYYDKYYENVLQATIYPKIICDITVLRFEQINSDGRKNVTDLFPSSDMPKSKCAALVYSNAGMLWYDACYKPEDIEDYEIEPDDNNIGFNFKTESFNFSKDKKDIFDLANAEYLEDKKSVPENDEISAELPTAEASDDYSAYDKIEKILTEAHKSNKNLLGEVINQVTKGSYVCDEAETPENTKVTEELVKAVNDVISETIIEEIIDEVSNNTVDQLPMDSVITDTEEAQTVLESVDESTEIDVLDEAEDELSAVDEQKEVESEVKEESIKISEPVEQKTLENLEFVEEAEESGIEVCEEAACDVVIHTKTGRYSYYGSIDENNCRNGIGRTVTPDGHTSYEGEYKDDKRDGFGVCYYNEGNINYVGNWINGNRHGCGVGYRLSDGTMHAGKWENNSPTGCGARFDCDGNFIEVSTYTNGQKDGKSISFDENGNIVIKKFRDGELVSEKIIADED